MSDLPKGWARTTLGDLGHTGLFADGDWVESKDQDPSGANRLIQLADLGVGTFRDKSNRWMNDEAFEDLNCTTLHVNDILIARMPEPLGRACLYPDLPYRSATVVDVAVLRPNKELLNPHWLMWTINTDAVSSQIASFATGTTRQSISRKNLALVEVPLPPLPEQHRIVEALEDHLSRLDAAERYVQSAVSRLGDMNRESLNQHFGRRDIPLGDLIEEITAGRSFGGANAPARADEWGIIKVSAMTWGDFRPSENKAVTADSADPRFEIRKGDLLVSRANTADYVGASVLVGEVRPKLLLSDKSLRITPKPHIDRHWLWHALQAPSARQQMSELATGTKDSMRNISQGSLQRILLPSANEAEQEEAVRRHKETATAIDQLRSTVTTAQSRSTALRRALLRAAFNGELVDQDPDDEPAAATLERLRAQEKPKRPRHA